MAFFSDVAQHLRVLGELFGDDVEAASLPVAVERLGDEAIVAVLTAATGLVRAGEKVRIAASGVAAARSTREAGHDGLAQKRGHRSPTSLIQQITGSTRAEAAKQVRLGESLLAGVAQRGGDDGATDASPTGDADTSAPATLAAREPWHAPLGRALLAGVIGSAQHDAILRGLVAPLGAPATPESRDGEGRDGDAAEAAFDVAAHEAWSLAAEQLIAEAAERTVEELGQAARAVRDQLDPEGARRRFDQRFDDRSFRVRLDADGVRRGFITFEDHGGAWTQAIWDAALRPRRGGPRFVDADERARGEELASDPRTNDQLAYDLLMDVLRAGALADAVTVFGARQPGVRVVVTDDALASQARGEAAVALVEDDQTVLPASIAAQQMCESGSVTCRVDGRGNPLHLGREARLFSARQRIALAIRDGGCRWLGCDRPASYCEAHHVDPYSDGGRTDIDRGILLCRWHHMELHHGGWRITREGTRDFVLHPPPGRGDTVVLAPRLALRYAWGDIDPPPRRFRPAA